MKTLLEEFRALPDYRKNQVAYTQPGEILFLSLLAVMSGADGFADIAMWMKARKKEIVKILGRPFKVPAYTTIRNTFLGMEIEAIEKMQAKWVEGTQQAKESEAIILSADGKTMRGSSAKALSQKARHIVSLFLSEAKLTLAQKEVDEKSNEIPALLELLEALQIEGCVITMDAMHTKKTLETIIEKGHHYIAQVKANNKKLLGWVKYNTSIPDNVIDSHQSVDCNTHGRHEQRKIELYDDLHEIDTLGYHSIKRVIKLTATTTIQGETTIQEHFYISSLQRDAKTFLNMIRSHWAIENSLHYVKDVSFGEDSCRTRTKQIPLMQTILRSFAINLFNLNHFANIKQARKELAWNPLKVFGLESFL